MKRARLVELMANVRATIVPFCSIMLFVAMGVGIFLGITWAAPSLQESVEGAFQEGSFHDLQVAFPYGLSSEDIDELSKMEGVAMAEGTRQAFQTYLHGDNALTVKVQTLGESIDVPFVVEGELPAERGQIAVKRTFARELGLGIGDTVVFCHDADGASDEDGMTYLTADTYTVTALVESPEYVSTGRAALGFSNTASGAVDMLAWVADASFDADAFMDGYPVVNVVCEGSGDLSTFGDEYHQRSQELVSRVSELGTKLAAKRYQSLHSQAQAQIDDGQAQLDEAREKERAAQEEIASGQARLDAGASELERGEAEAKAAQEQLAQAQATISTKEAEYRQAEQTLAAGKLALDQNQQKFDDLLAKRDEAETDLAVFKSLYQNEKDLMTPFQEREDAAYEAWWAADEAVTEIVNKKDSETEDLYDDLNKRHSELEEQGATDEEMENDPVMQELSAKISAIEERYQGPLDEAEAKSKELYEPYQAALRERESAEEASNARIDEAAAKLQTKYEALTGQKSSYPFNHYTADAAIALAEQKLGDFESMEFEYDGKKMTVSEARKQLADGWARYEQGKAELEQARRDLDAGYYQYQQGQQTAAAGQRELEAGRAEQAEGEQRLADARKELEEGRQRIEQESQRLDAARDELAGMREYGWTVLGRSMNGGVLEAQTVADSSTSLGFSMASLFLLVGLLVTYSAVGRVVREQIVQIGTKKALGMRDGEILAGFLAYSGLAVVLGSVLGVAIAVFGVEATINATLSQRFVVGSFGPYANVPMALAVCAVELALVLASTWLACRSVLTRDAVELLRGGDPPAAKERFFERWAVWKRLSVFGQVVVNNCVNDKRRVFATVVGVAGCAALITCAITFNDNVLVSYDRQYRDVYGFRSIAYLADASTDVAHDATTALEKRGVSSAAVVLHNRTVTTPEGDAMAARIMAPMDQEAFFNLYHLHPWEGSPSVADLSEDGVWVSCAYHAHRGADVGDEIVVYDGDGTLHRLPIAGFFDFYLGGNELVMSADAYRSEFGEDEGANAVLIAEDADDERVRAALGGLEGIESLVADAESQRIDFDAFASVSQVVVVVYVVLSALMAAVVLLNLSVMFIGERKRELIVLMINGFSVRQAKRYVTSDSVLLTVLGIILGVALGTAMGLYAVTSIEIDNTWFLKEVDLPAIAAGALATVVFDAVTMLVALRRIPAFKLTDISME